MTNHFSTCELTNRIENVDEYGNFNEPFYFTSTLESHYLTMNFEGHVFMQFAADAWYESYSFVTTSIDWSKMLGTWNY